jgi:hypothetical protein
MKLRTCDFCHNLFMASRVKLVKLNGKNGFICQDCIDLANGKISKESLVAGLNNGKIKIRR